MDILSYALGKRYTNEVALGIGAMRVEGSTVYFTIISTGEEVSVTLPTPKDGEDGLSIQGVTINTNHEIVCTLSDGTTVTSNPLSITEGKLTSPIKSDVAQGSVTKGKQYPVGTPLENIVRDMLTEQIPPTITLSHLPAEVLYDKVNSIIDELTTTVIATKKTNNISKIEYYFDNVLKHTINSGVSNGGSFVYKYPSPISDTITIKIVATDDKNLTANVTKQLKFVGNSYYGIIDANIGEPTETLVKTLNKKLKDTKKYVYSGINTDWGKICYAYPSEFGKLTSIMDKVNNFNYTSSFQLTTKTIDNIEYYVYTLIDPTGASNVELTFE